MRVLAALKHFDLVVYEGATENRKARLTPLARKILRDPRPNSPDRTAAIKEAALSPGIFKKLNEAWGTSPRSTAQRTYELENEYDFNPNSIPGVLDTYDATMRYAGLDEGEDSGDTGEDNETDRDSENGDSDADKGANTPPDPFGSGFGGGGHSDPGKVKMDNLTIPLRRDGTTAVLRAPSPLTDADIKSLRAWLTYYEGLGKVEEVLPDKTKQDA